VASTALIGVSLSWSANQNPIGSAPLWVQRVKYFAVYRYVALPFRARTGARPPTLAESGTPVFVAASDGHQADSTTTTPVFISGFRPGECFVARAFTGEVANAPDGSYSVPSAPVCVDASVKTGTTQVKYQLQGYTQGFDGQKNPIPLFNFGVPRVGGPMHPIPGAPTHDGMTPSTNLGGFLFHATFVEDPSATCPNGYKTDVTSAVSLDGENSTVITFAGNANCNPYLLVEQSST
jgi:hypothetical protein